MALQAAVAQEVAVGAAAVHARVLGHETVAIGQARVVELDGGDAGQAQVEQMLAQRVGGDADGAPAGILAQTNCPVRPSRPEPGD